MELFAQIRCDARVEGLSIRALARRHRCGRSTVRLALANAAPPPRQPRKRSSPRLDPFKKTVDEMLVSDLDAPRKQRHTARRIRERLIIEHGAQELSYSTVRDYVRVRRAQIDLAAGRRVQAFVPQTHPPGQEAEVDFGELYVVLGGVKTKCYLFVFRLSHSGKAIHRVYATCGQEAFLEGHIEAFNVLGGVPTRHIRYDNLTSAVARVVFGYDRQRVENQRWILFRSHFGFDPFYCQAGIEGAHEKGGVEQQVGWFRRNRLVPVPVVDSLEELNDRLRQWEQRDDGRRINDRITTIGQDFAVEQPLLAPLPVEEFDPGLTLNPRVDRSSLICVRMVKYSVPSRYIGRRVRVSLRATELLVFDGRQQIARHARCVRRGQSVLDLDHYLEVLKTKPGALPGATALVQARASGAFTAAHEAFWAAARRTEGDSGGTRALIDVLLLHRSLPAGDVVAGITSALQVGAVTADVVAVEARRHQAQSAGGSEPNRHRGEHDGVLGQRVVSLTQRRLADPAAVIAGLPADTRPLPSVAHYDQLLTTTRIREGQDTGT